MDEGTRVFPLCRDNPAMQPTEAANPDELAELAAFIGDRREQMTERWMANVRADPEIPTANNLAPSQLADHLPALFDDLVKKLRHGRAHTHRDPAKDDAESHGTHRWKQGYDVEELLREIILIRQLVIDDCGQFMAESPAVRDAVITSAKRLIREFFDDLVVESVGQYVSEQNEKMRGANDSLEQSNRQLAQTNDTLERVDRSRLRLTRNVSHELRNIANALNGAITLFAEADDDPAIRREMIGVGQRSLADMERLLNQLLDYSSLLAGAETLKLEPLDFAYFCDDIRSTFRASAQQQGLEFTVTCDVSGEARADYNRLKQIAANLIGNAIKYGKSGNAGRVTVTCAEGRDDTWTLTVEDTGPGIAPQHLKSIFSEFERGPADTTVQGTGLGLAITQHLVELHGGAIRAESTTGQGSRFRATFPRSGRVRNPATGGGAFT